MITGPGTKGIGDLVPQSPIRIVIGDDMVAIRRGIRLLLEAEPDLEVVGEAEDTDGIVVQAGEQYPQVVVMEVCGPKLDGFEACRQLRRLYPQVGVAFLTRHDSPYYFFEALRAGCHAYIPKSAIPSEVISGVHYAARQQSYLHPSLSKWLVQGFLNRSSGPRNHNSHELSSRDLQVLELVGHGLTNPEIAQQLQLSINTIRRHRARLMHKLGVHNVGGLIRFALNQGLLKIET